MSVQTPTQPSSGAMDVDEFLAFYKGRPSGERWQLIGGVAAMMAPTSAVHQRIAYNLTNLLNNSFLASNRDLFAYIAIGVRIPGVRDFHPEPDVSVVPGVATYDLYAERFLLVAEILSSSNTRKEIQRKLQYYRGAPHNLYALVLAQDEIYLELYAKDQNWTTSIFTAPDDGIKFPAFGLSFRLVDLYRGTPLDPQRIREA